MSRHPNQTKGLAAGYRAPVQDLNRHKPRAAANHMSAAELTKRDRLKVDDDAAALARSLAVKPLKPPHIHRFERGVCAICGKPQREWRLHVELHGFVTCNECGNSIEPGQDFYRDLVSGHLNRHAACHERAEGGGGR